MDTRRINHQLVDPAGDLRQTQPLFSPTETIISVQIAGLLTGQQQMQLQGMHAAAMNAAAMGALPGGIPGVTYQHMAFPGAPMLTPMIPRFR